MTFEERSEGMKEWVLAVFGRKAQQTEGRISTEAPTEVCPIQQQHNRLSKGTSSGKGRGQAQGRNGTRVRQTPQGFVKTVFYSPKMGRHCRFPARQVTCSD